MDRIDFIETREDIVQNIKTLYSYLDGKVDNEHKDWAIQRMSQGRNYVVEVVDSQIYFAPSRFVGYVDNTMEKHEANPGLSLIHISEPTRLSHASRMPSSA